MEFVLVSNFFQSILALSAVIILRKSAKTRSELRGWVNAFLWYCIGTISKFLSSALSISLFSLISLLSYIVSMVILTWIAYKEDKKIRINVLSKSGSIPIGMILAINPFQIGFQAITILILIIGLIFTYRIYQSKKTPTYSFLIFIFIFYIIYAVTQIISDTNLEFVEIYRISEIILATTYFMTAVVSRIELQLLLQQQEIFRTNNQLKDQLHEKLLMAENLSKTASVLSSSAEQIAASSENIASSQQNISRGASQQVVAVSNVQSQFQLLTKNISNIKLHVQNVNDFVGGIQTIAEQTNMLALNAAIEAARAGEQGRGFNVVADNVRKLADESKKMAFGSFQALEKVVLATKEQEKIAFETLKNIDAVAAVAEETSASTEESAAAAEEQSSSMEQITTTVEELSRLAAQLIK